MLRYVALGAVLVGLAASPAPKPTAPAPRPTPTNPFNLNPIPLPSASLDVIGTTRSKPVCTAIRRALKPAVEAARKNDYTFGVLRKTVFDYVVKDSDPARDLHLMQMDRQVDAMVKNVNTMEDALKSTALDIPPNAKPEDAKMLRDLRRTLAGVLAAQKGELNAMNGFVETERMRRFGKLSESEQNMQNALVPNTVIPGTGTMATPIPVSPFLRDTETTFNPQHMNGSPSGLRDGTLLDRDLGDIQAMVGRHEEEFTKVIVPAAKSCQ